MNDERPQHRRGERDRAAVQRRDVDEHHLGDRDRDEQRRDREDVRHARVDAGDELVVRPHEEADSTPVREGRVEHRLVGEQLLAREDRDDLGDDADRRQQHDVDLGVAEEPEQVLPEDRVAAACRDRRSRCRASGRRSSMTAPAISGPTDAMNRMLAITIIQTTIGMSNIFMPGAREFIAVVMKLMPPSRNATNSSATATTHSVAPERRQVVLRLGRQRRVRRPGAAEARRPARRTTRPARSR